MNYDFGGEPVSVSRKFSSSRPGMQRLDILGARRAACPRAPSFHLDSGPSTIVVWANAVLDHAAKPASIAMAMAPCGTAHDFLLRFPAETHLVSIGRLRADGMAIPAAGWTEKENVAACRPLD